MLTFAVAAVVVFSGYGVFTPAQLRCALPGSVGCPGGLLGAPRVTATPGSQWFNITMYDYGFWIVDTVTGANESNSWNLYEGWTVNVNGTSLPPDPSVGGTNQHGAGLDINGNYLMSLPGPVGSWQSTSFTAPSTPSTGNDIFCTIYCGPGHSSQRFSIVNVVAPPPTVSVTASPTSGAVPLAVSFTSTVNGGASPYTYSWDFGDGSAAATTANPSHTYSISGTFTASVVVTDSSGASAKSSVTITVSGAASLVASASATPTSGTVPLAVSFTGSATGGASPYNYSWAFGDGGTGSGTTATHTYVSAGNYTATLTVTDSSGTKAKSNVKITVSNSLPALLVTATASPSSGTAPLSVSFTATSSSGTAPYTAAWQFGDGTAGSGTSTTHTYNSAGSYQASVTLTDSTGRVGKASTYVNVTGGVTKPLAVYVTTNVSGGTAPLTISAQASISGGTGAYPTISWNLGDGTTQSGSSTVVHTYTSAGTYDITVTVTDSSGSTAKNGTTVTVSGALALGITVALNSTEGDAPFNETASASVFGGSSHFNAVTWDWGDGSTSTGTTVNHTYTTPGSYTITAKVTDSKGATATNTTSVKVDPSDTGTIQANYTGAAAPVSITFTFVPSTGSDLDLNLVHWNFGNGVNKVGPATVTENYTKSGSIHVTAWTNDSLGYVANATTVVNISSPGGGGGGGGKQSTGTYVQPVPWLGSGVGDPQTDALAVIFFLAVGLLYLLVTGPRIKPKKPSPADGKKGPSSSRSSVDSAGAEAGDG